MTERGARIDPLTRGKTGGTGIAADASTSESQSKENAKLRQIVQHFFSKAALTIVSSRVSLPQCFYRDTNQVRTNKWFNLILDESEALLDDVAEWEDLDLPHEKPPIMTIEIYLDTAELTRNQTLVIVDERGRKWDVCEALASPAASASSSRHKKPKSTQVVLERWNVSIGEVPAGAGAAYADTMPNVYKKAVVMFRSLYTYTRFLPAWRFGRQIEKQSASLAALRPMYRVYDGSSQSSHRDLLDFSLYPSAESTVEMYKFKPTKCSAGPLCIDVTYRVNCHFRVDDSEALLSSHFMGMDEHYFRPSLDDRAGQDLPYLAFGREVGSLPMDRRAMKDQSEQGQAYGSMSTFHNTNRATGASPISALRAARDMTMEANEDSPQKIPPVQRQSHVDRDSPKSVEGTEAPQRRISVSFQPFKAGSLSSSPTPLTPSNSIPKTSTTGVAPSLSRSRAGSSTLPQTALRQPPAPSNELAVGSPGSNSPKAPPINRYSSSFGHRRSRLSSGGGTGKAEDEQPSSGRVSQASSNQPSGLLAEGEGGGSSESAQTDDDQISDFLKLIEQKKDLQSLNRSDDASRDASARRTTAALSKFQRLRESHSVMSDSMSSSVMARSSTPSARPPPSSLPPSSVPPGLAGASVSTSSSPGKPISPHTPHTPLIPSRLSAHIPLEDSEPSRSRGQVHSSSEQDVSQEEDGDEHASGPSNIQRAPRAIPIPPQPYVRRSSSAANRQRTIDDLDEFGRGSVSLPIDERQDMSLSEIYALREPSSGNRVSTDAATAIPSRNRRESSLRTTEDQPSTSSLDSYEAGERRPSASAGSGSAGNPNSPLPYRPRLSRGGRRGSGGSSRFSSASNRAGSFAATAVDDEEPLLFTMSELGRRSLEDVRPSSGASGASGPAQGNGDKLGGGSGSVGYSFRPSR